MIIDRTGATALADVCANLFAALLLVVIVAAASQHRRSGSVVVLDAEPGLIAHKPLSPDNMVRALWRRGRPEAEVSIDLFKASMRIVGPEQDVLVPLPPERDLPALAGPAQLFVFDQAAYATARAVLANAGAFVNEELSPPAALRSRDHADWSPNFISLSARRLDFVPFRQELARLLDGGADSEADRRGEPTSAPSSPAVPREDTLPILGWRRTFARALVCFYLAIVVGFVVAVECAFAIGFPFHEEPAPRIKPRR